MNRKIVGIYLAVITLWTFWMPTVAWIGDRSYHSRDALWSKGTAVVPDYGQCALELILITTLAAGLAWLFRPKKA